MKITKSFLIVLVLIFVPIVSGKPQSAQPPNIIFILTDDQSYESLAHMPFMGTRNWFEFTNAYVNVALCCPSRATILSGMFSHKSGVENNKLGYLHNDTIDIAARLNAAGYTTFRATSSSLRIRLISFVSRPLAITRRPCCLPRPAGAE